MGFKQPPKTEIFTETIQMNRDTLTGCFRGPLWSAQKKDALEKKGPVQDSGFHNIQGTGLFMGIYIVWV